MAGRPCNNPILVLRSCQLFHKEVMKMHHTGPIETIISGGTFGLPTNGHRDMWQKAARSAEKLVIVIANNPGKKSIFSSREIFGMVKAIVADIPNAEVCLVKDKYLVRYAEEIGATHVFRGLRDYKDLAEEQVARSVNRVIAPDVDSEYFIPDADKFQISSSMVLSLVGFEGWEELVANYVHPVVLAKLIDWHYVRQHWHRFWNAVDAQDDETVMWNNITSRYGEDHRAYHNLLFHIALALREFDKVKHLAEDPLALEMAIWYHDIKYDPKRSDNEARSADFARAAARKMGLADSFGRKAANLITNANYAGGHATFSNRDTRLFYNIDYSILGEHPVVYGQYADAIREEFSHVSDVEFASGRTTVLRNILGFGNNIFTLNCFHDRLETQAQTNIQAEIERLNNS